MVTNSAFQAYVSTHPVITAIAYGCMGAAIIITAFLTVFLIKVFLESQPQNEE